MRLSTIGIRASYFLFTVLEEQRKGYTVANRPLHSSRKRIVLQMRRVDRKDGNTFLYGARDQGYRISIPLLERQESILFYSKFETLLRRAGI